MSPRVATECAKQIGSPAATAAFGVRWLNTAFTRAGSTARPPQPNQASSRLETKAASSRRTPKSLTASAGFTLLELLGVIGIISILLGLLLTAITTVTRYSRDAIARAEVKMLESAWKQYYAHYRTWPEESDDDDILVVTGLIARALEGDAEAVAEFNPDGLSWMEFTRFDFEGAPVNPWGNSQRIYATYRFFVRFDTDGSGWIDLPDDETMSNGDHRSWRPVIVWTHSGNPRRRNEIIGSWQE